MKQVSGIRIWKEKEVFIANIGDRCVGEGYSGMTDGVLVTGKILSIDSAWGSCILLCEKRNMPCAVKSQTLKKAEDE